MKAFLFQLICIILIYQTVRNHCDVQRSLWNQFTRALGPVMLTSLVPSEPVKSCFHSWFSSLSSLKSLLFLQCLHLHLRTFVQQHFLNNKDRCFKKKLLLTLNTCQRIYQQTRCLKFVKRKNKPEATTSEHIQIFHVVSVFVHFTTYVIILVWS